MRQQAWSWNSKAVMRGGIERARTALGLAKIRGGDVADVIVNVVENKECCLVFCAHQKVSDELGAQLHRAGIKSLIVDGRTPPAERARIESVFQAGSLQVFIGGINSAGESMTLHRADTVIFVELDWVPAALTQAEDRIHRKGQIKNCHVIHLIARLDGLNLDHDMISILGSKLARIGEVLGENTDNIVHEKGSIQAVVFEKLLSKSRVKLLEVEKPPLQVKVELKTAETVKNPFS